MFMMWVPGGLSWCDPGRMLMRTGTGALVLFSFSPCITRYHFLTKKEEIKNKLFTILTINKCAFVAAWEINRKFTSL